jgi:hypothetical protein
MLLCDGQNALSMDFFKSGSRTNESIRVAKRMGWFTEMEPMSLYETPACRGLLVFILVVFGIVFIGMCLQCLDSLRNIFSNPFFFSILCKPFWQVG